jgi:hypothetical protein
MIASLNSIYAPMLLVFTLPVLVTVAWVKGWWGLGTRIFYTASVIASFMVVWWANYWNLIGFHL